MDYEQLAKEVIKGVGGSKNVSHLTHCYTRLRFKLVNVDKADKAKIEQLDGVMSVVYSGGEYQVVIGPEVGNVYQQILANKLVANVETDGASEADSAPVKKNFKYWFDLCLDVLVSCFTPIIPAIAGSGMIKVLTAILVSFHWLSDKSQTYVVMNAIGDGIFYFLPFFVAITAAKRLKADQFISMTIAAIIMYPKLEALVAKGTIHFIGLPMQLVDYSSQALPLIFAVILVKYAGKLAEKISPTVLKVWLVPMITLLISAPLTLFIFGPFATYLGSLFAIFTNIMNHWGWIAVGLNAALFPILVMTGTHNALIPLMIQMFATQGFDAVLVPSGLAANIAESGAAAAVATKTKDMKMKSTASGAAISALFGITEPALYGVNLKLKRPFIGMILGSLIGGGVAGLIHLTAYAFVSPSLLSLPIFIGKNSNLVTAIIAAVVTFVVTFAITWILGFKDVSDNQKAKTEGNTTATVNHKAVAVNMTVPVSGQIISLSELGDQVFAKGLLGKGFAVKPSSDTIVAPVSGTVTTVFPTKHAIGLKTDDGLEVMVHMGIDTVELKGKYFEDLVKAGDQVTSGQALAKMDIDQIAKAGYQTSVIIVVTNTAQFANVTVTPSADKREVGFTIEK